MAADAASTGAEYKKGTGPFNVGVKDLEWLDGSRNRDLPAKVFYPSDATGQFPVVVFSHGLGGTKETYSYLGRHWASHGYVSVHLQHHGIDASAAVAKKGTAKTSVDVLSGAESLVQRPQDVGFALDQIGRMNKDDPALSGRLDVQHIGMAGHSLGAFTTLLMAGQVFITPTLEETSVADKRITAAIVMSPPVIVRIPDEMARMYSHISIPCLHMTGSRDGMLGEGGPPVKRRMPFDNIPAPDQYLVMFQGGDHMIFAGRRVAMPAQPKDERFHDLIRMSSTAFWDAYLKGNAEAKAGLADGGFAAALGEDGSLEKKR